MPINPIENKALWTRGRGGKWQLLGTFNRYWEAPGSGEGLGDEFEVMVYKKGDYRGRDTKVRLTSRVFMRKNRMGTTLPMAFAEEIDEETDEEV